jgi:hypothetical protein
MDDSKEIVPVESQLPQGEKELAAMFGLANTVVNKSYLENLNRMEIVSCPKKLQKVKLNDISRFFRLERFVTEKNENSRDKLVSVFHAIASCGGSVLILINSDGRKIDYYFGTKTPDEQNPDILGNSIEALEKALKGNFPGTKVESVREGNEINELMDEVFLNTSFSKQEKQICTITGIAGLRSKDENSEKLFVQGMEKLIDSMRGEKYSLLLIADPVTPAQIELMKQGYENLYSELVPYAERELNMGENVSASESLSESVSKSISESVANTLSYTKGSFRSHSHTSSNEISMGISAGISMGPLSFGRSAGFSHSESDSNTSGTSENVTKGKTTTKGTTDTEQTGKTDTKALGTSRSVQIKQENKTLKNLMEKINIQLERLTTSADVGMWNCSVYCLADVAAVCKITASSYQSLLRGENSSVEMGSVTQWAKDKSLAIIPWLEKMRHPLFKLDADREITPTSCVSSSELAIHAGIPQLRNC